MSARLSNPNYVEAVFLFYSDGTCGVYIDDRNSAITSYNPTYTYHISAGIYTYNGRALTGRGHTHDDDSPASDADIANKQKTLGLNHYIWNGRYFVEY